MKIKTYTARDMKAALRQVRDEQGPDAVILATRHFAGGVEVSIAVEPDAALLLETPLAAPVAAVPAADDFASILARTAAPAAPAAASAQLAPLDPRVSDELRSMRQ